MYLCIPKKPVIEVNQPRFDIGMSFEDHTAEFEDDLDVEAHPDVEFDLDSEYDTDLQDRVIDHIGDY